MKEDKSSITINENLTKSNNGNGSTKAFAGVIGLMLVIAGVYAMIEPMNQRIDFLERQITSLKNSHANKEDEHSITHRDFVATLSSTTERFAEVETQFDDIERRIQNYENWQQWWQRNVPYINATQNEKIYRLEQTVFNSSKKTSNTFKNSQE